MFITSLITGAIFIAKTCAAKAAVAKGVTVIATKITVGQALTVTAATGVAVTAYRTGEKIYNGVQEGDVLKIVEGCSRALGIESDVNEVVDFTDSI